MNKIKSATNIFSFKTEYSRINLRNYIKFTAKFHNSVTVTRRKGQIALKGQKLCF